jgi:hypothetical protein
VRSVSRGLCRTVAKAASVSGYSASKCGAGFVHMWLDCKRGSKGNGLSGCKGGCKKQADEAYRFSAT